MALNMILYFLFPPLPPPPSTYLRKKILIRKKNVVYNRQKLNFYLNEIAEK